jgi:hypothetical protein
VIGVDFAAIGVPPEVLSACGIFMSTKTLGSIELFDFSFEIRCTVGMLSL